MVSNQSLERLNLPKKENNETKQKKKSLAYINRAVMVHKSLSNSLFHSPED